MSDFYETFMKEQRARLESACGGPRRAELMKILCDAGVDEVMVGFDGSGDSGQIEECRVDFGHGEDGRDKKRESALLKAPIPGTEREFQDWGGGKLDSVIRCESVRERIEDLCYDLLSGAHPGWEINEGSFGEFVIRPSQNQIALTFNERIETYETAEEEF